MADRSCSSSKDPTECTTTSTDNNVMFFDDILVTPEKSINSFKNKSLSMKAST